MAAFLKNSQVKKKNDIFRFLSILKEKKKKKERTSDMLLPGTDTVPKENATKEMKSCPVTFPLMY